MAKIAADNFIRHAQCFIEGTLVETEDGLKPIEDIKVGDKVLAYDEETGEQAYKSVVRLFRNETKEWYHIFVNGEEIVCSEEKFITHYYQKSRGIHFLGFYTI